MSSSPAAIEEDGLEVLATMAGLEEDGGVLVVGSPVGFEEDNGAAVGSGMKTSLPFFCPDQIDRSDIAGGGSRRQPVGENGVPYLGALAVH
ncbi:hypothetical protein ACLOJK_010142 [Asimina triloba]